MRFRNEAKTSAHTGGFKEVSQALFDIMIVIKKVVGSLMIVCDSGHTWAYVPIEGEWSNERGGGEVSSLGFDVDGDVGVGAVVGAEEVFNLGGFVVGFVEGDGAVHQDVEFDGVVVADTAGAEVVGMDVAGEGLDEVEDLFFDGIGKRLFHEVADAVAQQVDSDFDDEGADDD